MRAEQRYDGRRRRSAGGPLLALGALAVPGALAALLAARSLQWGPWVGSALTSRLSLWCLAILVASAAALTAVLAVLYRAGSANRRRPRRGEQGVAILEFALALPIALMLVLIMAQTSLLMGGNICVHYAAYCAGRSAIVHVPEHYSDVEPPNIMVESGSSGKFMRIRQAALWAVMPISCGSASIDEHPVAAGMAQNLERLFVNNNRPAPAWLDARMARKLQYADDHTEVRVSGPANGVAYGPAEDIDVEVRHTFYLSVPYAARLFASFNDDGRQLDFGEGEYGTVITARCRLTIEGVQYYVEEEMIR